MIVKVLNFCFSLTANSTVLSTSSTPEQQYQKVYKKIISFLYQNPECRMSFSFSGPQLEWFEKKHPEVLQIFRELVARKQVELLGGGYYNPVFPLLAPVDRSGQIELLTAELRRITGKRPRGLSILSSVWDNSLIPCFQNCGMEWIQLDSSLIQEKNIHYLPLILSEQGKIMKILPAYRNLDSTKTPQEYLTDLVNKVEEKTKNDEYSSYVTERIILVNLELEKCEKFIANGWLESFFKTAKESFSENVKICLPTEYIHRAQDFVPSFIGRGIRDDVAKWADVPYEQTKKEGDVPVLINNFLLTYSRCRSLYNRELYISMLISNCHGDKARKTCARSSLWKAQAGETILCSPEGVFADNELRQNAYKNLTEAEKFVRDAAEFKESVTSFDYNADGHNEYICSMEKYTACISRRSGQVKELNIIHNSGNYADNLRRIKKFDGINDDYERGLFVDHIFSNEEFEDYKKGLESGDGVFSKVLFKEQEFNGLKREIKIRGEGTYSLLNLPVSLKKRYSVNSNGFTVQYILKNEGPIPFSGTFAVESNFAQMDFSSPQTSSYKLDLISAENGLSYEPGQTEVSLNEVSFMQITDLSNNVSFVYEPNEEAGIACRTLYLKRPTVASLDAQISENTFVASLYWKFDLAAGMEMEKTINFSIIIPKKRRAKKN